MNIIQAIILGIVEGITEFLPVSSTGHLILASRLLAIPSSEFLKSFEISIQLGAILAVVFLYGKRINLQTAKRVGAAFLPTAVVGFTLYPLVKHVLLDSIDTVLFSLLIGGIILILFEWLHGEKDFGIERISDIPYRTAVVIGLFQSIALIPGVSRAAATIVGGLWMGVRRKTIVEFSFLLAVPTMLAATALDILKSGAISNSRELGLLAVGGVTSFLVALAAIKFFLKFIQRNSFVWFGVYRVTVAVILLFAI